MEYERLSKLQKWILNRCLENKENGIIREEIREFFGKKLPPKRYLVEALRESAFRKEGEKFNWEGRYFSPKKELISTRSIEASISRSFNNLIRKGFITDRYYFGQCFFLTEKGFLKVNEKTNCNIVNSYKNYVDIINKANEERGEDYKKLVGDLKNIKKGD
ncbi:hypothetical protein ES705_44771 [subsurface metagenome]